MSVNKQSKKILVKHLDLGDGRYIENDKIKYVISDGVNSEYLSWDELWLGIKSDIEKIQKNVQKQNNQP